MNGQTLAIYAAAAAGVFAVTKHLAQAKPAAAAGSDAATPFAMRPLTAADWLLSSGQQQTMSDAAVAKNWQDTFGLLDKTDPGFWL